MEKYKSSQEQRDYASNRYWRNRELILKNAKIKRKRRERKPKVSQKIPRQKKTVYAICSLQDLPTGGKFEKAVNLILRRG